jgi:flagellar export protein FliJ
MKRFRFPLKPVGVLRAHQEARARAAFATTVQAYVQAEETLARTRARVAELEAILFNNRQDTFRPSESAAFFQHYRQESNTVIAAEQKVFAAAETMRQARAAYIAASQATKVITRLEEKSRLHHRQETERILQAELDEFAALRRSAAKLVA